MYYHNDLSTLDINRLPCSRLFGASSAILYLWKWEEGGYLISRAARAPWERYNDFLREGKHTCVILIENLQSRVVEAKGGAEEFEKLFSDERRIWHHRGGICISFMECHYGQSLLPNSTLRRGETVSSLRLSSSLAADSLAKDGT